MTPFWNILSNVLSNLQGYAHALARTVYATITAQILLLTQSGTTQSDYAYARADQSYNLSRSPITLTGFSTNMALERHLIIQTI